MNNLILPLAVAGSLFGLVNCATAAPLVSSERAVCPVTTPETFNLNVIRHFRLYTDATTGDSKVEQVPLPAKQIPLLTTGKILKEFDLGAAKKVKLVIAPPNLNLPMHPSPYLETFLVLSGSTEMFVADGTKVTLIPGDMVTMDDMGSKTGHGGHIGACGYVDIDIVPQ